MFQHIEFSSQKKTANLMQIILCALFCTFSGISVFYMFNIPVFVFQYNLVVVEVRI